MSRCRFRRARRTSTALRSVAPIGTWETALASWRSDVRGVVFGLVDEDGAPRFTPGSGSMALLTKGLSLSVRSRRIERRRSPPSVSRWTSRWTSLGGQVFPYQIMQARLPPETDDPKCFVVNKEYEGSRIRCRLM